jgi:hypothetical protein
MLNVLFGRFRSVMGGVMEVALGRVRMVRGGFVVTSFVMPGSLAMMSRGVLVMLGCLVMMLGCFLGHGFSFGRGSWAGRP